jgi:hypothetical protein
VPRTVKYTARSFLFRTDEAAWLHKGTVESQGRPTARRDARPRLGGPVHQVLTTAGARAVPPRGRLCAKPRAHKALNWEESQVPQDRRQEKPQYGHVAGVIEGLGSVPNPLTTRGFRRTALAGRLPSSRILPRDRAPEPTGMDGRGDRDNVWAVGCSGPLARDTRTGSTSIASCAARAHA